MRQSKGNIKDRQSSEPVYEKWKQYAAAQTDRKEISILEAAERLNVLQTTQSLAKEGYSG